MLVSWKEQVSMLNKNIRGYLSLIQSKSGLRKEYLMKRAILDWIPLKRLVPLMSTSLFPECVSWKHQEITIFIVTMKNDYFIVISTEITSVFCFILSTSSL